MNIENEVFNKSKFNYDKLVKYGFKKNKDIYLYNKNILNNSFNIEVTIKSDKVKVKVIDLSINEEELTSFNKLLSDMGFNDDRLKL